MKTSQISQDSASLEPDNANGICDYQKNNIEQLPTGRKIGKMFYMSSEESSEVADSPTADFVPNSTIIEAKYELSDYTESRKYSSDITLQSKGAKMNGNGTLPCEDEDGGQVARKPKSLNPFESSGSDKEESFSYPLGNEKRKSLNPFDSESDEDEIRC